MYMVKMQIACLCVILLLLVSCCKNRALNTRNVRIFRLFLALVAANLVFDMVTVYTVNHRDALPVFINRGAHIMYIGSMTTGLWLLLLYVVVLLDMGGQKNASVKYFANIPLGIALLLIVFAPITYVDTEAGSYSTGIPVWTCYVCGFYYICLAAVLCVRYREKIDKEKKELLFIALGLILAGIVIQLINPALLISGMWVTIIALSIFLIRENPEDLFDVDTGTFNEAAFLKMIHENIYNREKFHVILFTVSNMDMIREGYGSQTGKACLRTISNKIYSTFRHNTYALDDNELVFFAGSRQAADRSAAFLEQLFASPLPVLGEEIQIQAQVRPWTFEKTETEDQILYDIEDYFTQILAKSVYVDHFSGLMNRNAYERDLTHLFRHHELNGVFCSMVDINNLKKMNDSCGHVAGDALIKGCGDMLKKCMPSDARIYRIGGDEFAVLNLSKTQEEMDSIFDEIKKYNTEAGSDSQYPLEFAVGTVEYDPVMDANLFDAFDRADKKMYHAKEQMHLEWIATRSGEDWDWIHKMDALSYESLLFRAWCEISDSFLFIENEVNHMTRWSTIAVDEFELEGEYTYQGMRKWATLIHPKDREEYQKALALVYGGVQRHFQCAYRVENRWGEYVEVEESAYLCRDENGKDKILVGIITPQTETAHVDAETGLFDKYEFTDRVQKLCNSHNTTTGIMLVGLNHFRKINTMYSYAVGDEVLKTVAEKLEHIAPVRSSQYRYGGDMFALIYPHTSKMELYRLFDQLEKSLEGFEVDTGERIYLTLSGGAIMLENGMTPDSIKNSLEHAVKMAKETGRGVLEFASGSQMKATESRFRMREELRRCVRDGMYGFYLYFQPLLRGEDKELFGCETLLRWHHPNYEGYGPEQFIPILEETGQIMEAGRWVITTALMQVKKWQKIKPDMSVNVNVSYVQMQQPDLAAFIVNELKRLELSPGSIIVELTESCKISNYDGAIEFVNFLRSNGIAFALDDFGTGYSSFEVLKNVPTDWIKLEHHYVSSIKNSVKDRNILLHIIDLCHSLGIKVCAEGIEDEEVCESMRERNVEFLQGYYISKPLSASQFEERFLTKI